MQCKNVADNDDDVNDN